MRAPSIDISRGRRQAIRTLWACGRRTRKRFSTFAHHFRTSARRSRSFHSTRRGGRDRGSDLSPQRRPAEDGRRRACRANCREHRFNRKALARVRRVSSGIRRDVVSVQCHRRSAGLHDVGPSGHPALHRGTPLSADHWRSPDRTNRARSIGAPLAARARWRTLARVRGRSAQRGSRYSASCAAFAAGIHWGPRRSSATPNISRACARDSPRSAATSIRSCGALVQKPSTAQLVAAGAAIDHIERNLIT